MERSFAIFMFLNVMESSDPLTIPPHTLLALPGPSHGHPEHGAHTIEAVRGR